MEGTRLRWVHRLSEVDHQVARAVCAACGPVDIVLQDKGYGNKVWRCKNKMQELESSRRKSKSYKDYQREYQRGWRAENPAYVKHVNLRAALRRYGLSEEQYQAELEKQAGRCPICGELVGKFVIDHDHVTGKFRGLICHWCNWMLGAAHDRPSSLRTAAVYLETRNLSERFP